MDLQAVQGRDRPLSTSSHLHASQQPYCDSFDYSGTWTASAVSSATSSPRSLQPLQQQHFSSTKLSSRKRKSLEMSSDLLADGSQDFFLESPPSPSSSTASGVTDTARSFLGYDSGKSAGSLSKCRRTKSFVSLNSITSDGRPDTSTPTPVCGVATDDGSSSDTGSESDQGSAKGRTVSEGSQSRALQEPIDALSSDEANWGWFIKTDDETGGSRRSRSLSVRMSRSKHDSGLAFMAHASSKAEVELDPSVKWASAADTVDAVLGELPEF